jgi:hypothetical protein
MAQALCAQDVASGLLEVNCLIVPFLERGEPDWRRAVPYVASEPFFRREVLLARFL